MNCYLSLDLNLITGTCNVFICLKIMLGANSLPEIYIPVRLVQTPDQCVVLALCSTNGY